jgi:hypothetical protein
VIETRVTDLDLIGEIRIRLGPDPGLNVWFFINFFGVCKSRIIFYDVSSPIENFDVAPVAQAPTIGEPNKLWIEDVKNV